MNARMPWEKYVKDRGRKTIEIVYTTKNGVVGEWKVRGYNNAIKSIEEALENDRLEHFGFEFRGECGYTEWVDIK